MATNTDTMETADMRRALTLTEIGVIVSLLCSCGVAVFTLGVVYAQVQQNTQRIETIEPKVNAVELRIERIDTNVEILVERAREERARR